MAVFLSLLELAERVMSGCVPMLTGAGRESGCVPKLTGAGREGYEWLCPYAYWTAPVSIGTQSLITLSASSSKHRGHNHC